VSARSVCIALCRGRESRGGKARQVILTLTAQLRFWMATGARASGGIRSGRFKSRSYRSVGIERETGTFWKRLDLPKISGQPQ
jgi:hypothetical protein